MTHTPDQLLRAAQVAEPKRQWVIIDGRVMTPPYCPGKCCEFDPHDPTKGDLAALNEALERAGWVFWCRSNGEFVASHPTYKAVSPTKTSALRAQLCVEAMGALDGEG